MDNAVWLAGVFGCWMVSSWLVPNHYPPWTSAWSDGWAMVAVVGLAVALLRVRGGAGFLLAKPLAGFALLGLGVVWVQWASGKLLFFGDALVVTLYLGMWVLAVVMGGGLITTSAPHHGPPPKGARGKDAVVSAFLSCWVLAAVVSVGVALAQWAGVTPFGIYAIDLPPGGRPFGNVGQANNFCSLCFMGLCGVLFLYQERRIGGFGLWLTAGFVLMGMAASQSRTGWLQVGVLVGWGLWVHKPARLLLQRRQLLVLALVYAAWVVMWPSLSDALLLSSGRSLLDQTQAGLRWPFWRLMVDALSQHPLTGYGWQQVNMAQQLVALAHPSGLGMFEHSHNLLLDLWAWSGMPVGTVMAVLLGLWLFTHMRQCRDAGGTWLLVALLGIAVHSLLEFALEQAYFLMPVGVAMGMLDGLSRPTLPPTAVMRLPRATILLVTTALAGLLVWTAKEYAAVEQDYRLLRFASARIGRPVANPVALELHVLTQWQAFLHFAWTEAKPGMTPGEVDAVRQVSARFGYPPVMFRYALAAGLNGQPEVATLTLARLCHIHEPARCIEAREGWEALQLRYPQLVGLFPAPLLHTP